MTLASTIPADVMERAQGRYELGSADYRSTPQMIAEAVVAERAECRKQFVERVEKMATSRLGSTARRLTLESFAADLRKEGW